MRCLVLTVIVVVAWAVTLGLAWLLFRMYAVAAANREDAALRVVGAVLLMAAVCTGVGALLSLRGSKKDGS